MKLARDKHISVMEDLSKTECQSKIILSRASITIKIKVASIQIIRQRITTQNRKRDVMGMYERDPRNIGYIALFVALTWYKQIPSEAAWRIAQGKSSAKKGNKLTPETKEQIYKMVFGPTFRSFNVIEKKYKINRYDIVQSEEEIIVSKGNMLIKGIADGFNELRKLSNNCIASECEGCFLNNVIGDNKTFCELLLDTEIDEQGKPIYTQKSNVRKCPQMSARDILQGETVRKTFRVYKKILPKIDEYIKTHPKERLQDFASAALVEAAERHK
jgi:hypothetical protein